MSESESARAFVDTSIQYLRLLYSNAKKRDTERDLSAYTLICSQTVYREFFIALTKAFDFVTSVLNDRGDLPSREGLAELQRGLVSFRGSRRELQKVQFVLALLTEICGEDLTSEDLATYADGEIIRLKNRGFFVFGSSFASMVDIREEGNYLASVDCSVADRLIEAGNSTPSCNMATRTCSIRPFLAPHRLRLAEAAYALRDDRERHRTRLIEITEKPEAWWAKERSAIGQRLCWPIGDTLIAAECPPDALILTTDNDYEALSPIFDRQVRVVDWR